MSPGFLSTSRRKETVEGIDKKLAVHYYAGFMFTYELLGGLKEAKEKNEDVKVLSILMGREANLTSRTLV
jgi:hypothetical protein